MRTFAGIPKEFSDFKKSKAIIVPVPYDGTSTWKKGADKGPNAILDAAENMELFDIETGFETYKHGIHLHDLIPISTSPKLTNNNIYRITQRLLTENKLLTFLGGEHSISIGIIQAFKKKYPELSVVQFDAHLDLRDSYEGTEYNHACALHWANLNTDLHQIGIRSMDVDERKNMNAEKVVLSSAISDSYDWTELSNKLNEFVYLTIDLDVLDPSIMPSTGTPEPGGLNWNQLVSAIRTISKKNTIVGFDIVELCPNKHNYHSDFTAAKLLYKTISFILNK